MKTAIIHDWLTGQRGGEMGLEILCQLYPDATIFTLLHKKGSVSPVIENMKIKTSFVQQLPFAEEKYRNYLALFPMAVESFDLKGYDVIISHSHCVAKGAIPQNGATHICYCYTPMRYAWLFYDEYFGNRNILAQGLIKPILADLRRWDKKTSKRVNYFVACSQHVRKRIQDFYDRDADVVYCPVDTSRFNIGNKDEDFYLIISAFVPYKKIDLAIEAFNKLDKPLYVIGGGPDEKRLRKMAGPKIKFLGWKTPDELVEYFSKCRALVFPGEEDFGIVPVEAQASGRPVIAYKKGGALETVVEGETGVFFEKQAADSLADAVTRFEKMSFDKNKIRQNALKFDKSVFKEKMRDYVKEKTKK